MKQIRINLLLKGSLCALSLCVNVSAHASGFQTSFHSVSSFSRGLGGAGVSADDLVDIYYNPAAVSMYSPGNFQVYGALGPFANDFELEMFRYLWIDYATTNYTGDSERPGSAVKLEWEGLNWLKRIAYPTSTGGADHKLFFLVASCLYPGFRIDYEQYFLSDHHQHFIRVDLERDQAGMPILRLGAYDANGAEILISGEAGPETHVQIAI